MAIYKQSAAVPRELSQLIKKAAKKSLGKRGFNEGKIITAWPDIVGKELARYCVPEKISHDRSGARGATLCIACEPAWATEMQYHIPVIIDHIAAFFGYRAVERITIKQRHIEQATPISTVPAAAPEAPINASLATSLERAQDEDIKAALEQLARRLSTSDNCN